jgi:PHD/YefM family antitoxin component YafN of YafNO toxin-antitoxin module
METFTLTSDIAQLNWREAVDVAHTDKQEIVIEKHGKPVATLVNYELFQRMKHELLILQGLKRAEKNCQERLENPSSTVTLTELAAKLNLADQPEATSTKTLLTLQN